jgi:hypothetical protein
MSFQETNIEYMRELLHLHLHLSHLADYPERLTNWYADVCIP